VNNPFGALFERRSAIASPFDLLSAFGRGAQSTAGQNVNESSAYAVPAVLSCINIRQRSLGSLPIRVYERLDERSSRPVPWHRASFVLRKPNGWQTWSEFAGTLEAHRVLRGNAYAYKDLAKFPGGDGKMYEDVAQLIPLHPDRMQVDGDVMTGGPSQYRYTTQKGTQLTFSPRQILHLRGLSTDGLVGRSVLQDMREPIGGAIATQEHANSLWSRDATPSVVLSHPKTLSPQARTNLEDSWESTYGRGADKKRVAVLEEGLTLEKLSLTPEDGQFLETRKLTRAEIAGAFCVPPHMIGDVDRSTSWGSGIEQQQIGFLTFTLRPDLVLWEQRLTLDLIAQPERFYIKFAIEGFMRGDSAAQAAFFRVMREVGAMSANDIRALMDWNPIENGDTYLQPVNLAPLGFTPAPKGTA
jgi:HK97 family phage portal protein